MRWLALMHTSSGTSADRPSRRARNACPKPPLPRKRSTRYCSRASGLVTVCCTSSRSPACRCATRPTLSARVVAAETRWETPATRPFYGSRRIGSSESCLPRRGSAPERPRRQTGALGKRLELGPHHLRVHALQAFDLREPAIGAGDHVFLADQAGETHQPVGDHLGVLHR